MTPFLVTNIKDSGTRSLRLAMIDANNPAIDVFGGQQLRDGRFNDRQIAGGTRPPVQLTGDGVIISGPGVGDRGQFEFVDALTAPPFAATTDGRFSPVADAGTIAVCPSAALGYRRPDLKGTQVKLANHASSTRRQNRLLSARQKHEDMHRSLDFDSGIWGFSDPG